MGELGNPDISNVLPALSWLTPETEEYKTRRLTYCASNDAVPRAILCPQNAGEVSSIVRLAREYDIPLSVRSGGHDVQGRSVVDNAYCVDMRDIDHVQIAADRKTAVIGGGIRFGKLLEELHKEGLVTPFGSVPSVGYVGWATLGGYSCLAPRCGLGVDQILEAEVVNDKGDVVNADEGMLKGIRGGGGNFGIITSLRIKIYELKTLLAGLLVLDSSAGISVAFKSFISKLRELELDGLMPPELFLQPMVINHPEAGRSLCTTFVWSSDDHEEGQRQLQNLIQRLPVAVLMNTVAAMSPPGLVRNLDNYIAKSVWGGSQAISFDRLSNDHLDTIGQGLEEMPSDPGTCFCLHTLPKACPSFGDAAYAAASCFNPESRQAHTVVEIIGQAVTQEGMEHAGKWARSMHARLLASNEAMKGSYVSMVDPSSVGLEELYGEKLPLLKALKQKYDPEGIFRYAVPRLLD